MRWIAVLSILAALFLTSCETAEGTPTAAGVVAATAMPQPASVPLRPTVESVLRTATEEQEATQGAVATFEDRVQAWATVGAGAITAGTILFLVLAFINERRKQRLEVEGYLRVDLGTPQRNRWTTDFPPPDAVAYKEDRDLVDLSDAPDDPILAVWFTNQQKHSLGIALGVGAVIDIEFTDRDGKSEKFPLKPRIAYIEPGKCVQVNLMQFPPDWQVKAVVTEVEYRNLYSDSRSTQHGRLRCRYAASTFESTPLSDPYNRFIDKLRALFRAPEG